MGWEVINDEMGSVHPGRTSGTLDPAVAFRRNNCYGMKKSYLGEILGTENRQEAPKKLGRKEDILSSSSTLVTFPLSLPIGEVYTEPTARTKL